MSHGVGMIERCDKIVAAGGAINIFIHAHKHAFDLFIQFGAVPVTINTREFGTFSRIHFASQTIVRLLPDPVCVPDNTAFDGQYVV